MIVSFLRVADGVWWDSSDKDERRRMWWWNNWTQMLRKRTKAAGLAAGVPSPRFTMDIGDVAEMKYSFWMEIIEVAKASNG